MVRHDCDPFIDLSYFFAFLIALGVFIIRFLSAFGPGSLNPVPEGDMSAGKVAAEALALDAFSVVKGALLSCTIFLVLLVGAVIAHESGHMMGGLLTGYILRHFCLFGVVLSFGGTRRVRFDRSALLGGYVVMCSGDTGRSPMTLLRAGPFFECTLMTAAAVSAALLPDHLTGVFVIGEILSFLCVRSLTAGRSACSDSATAAQVRAEGPADYNRLMDHYDEELTACTKRVPGPEDCGDDHNDLTVKEELSLYVKKE
ncbi:MAG: hypothetical protein IKR54_06210 [Lachnospiraceae bacterium]|nr:hypothetical protein [Lachnospiraceae bacterium]